MNEKDCRGLNNSTNGTAKPMLQCCVLLCVLYIVTYSVISLGVNRQAQVGHELDSIRTFLLFLMSPILFKYLIQLVSLPLYPLLEKFRNEEIDQLNVPLVSVLVPAWNEEIGILKTLRSIVNTQYSALEIIIINDGSSDNTHRLVSKFIQDYEQKTTSKSKLPPERLPATIKYLKLPNGGKAIALNHGLRIANGEIVVTLDADSVMDKDMITNMLRRFTDSRVAAVAGNVIVGNRKKPIELLQQLEYLQGFCFKRADSNFNAVHIIGGAAAAYRKEALEAVGGFDPNIITEDVEISTRLLAAGYKTRYASNAVVYTEGPSDWKSLCSQRLRWKFGRLLTYSKHRTLVFSASKQHNPYLSLLVLPVAIYAELMLLIEPLLLSLFYGYTFYTDQYLPLILMICLIAGLITLQILFDSKVKFHLNLMLLAPIAWILFYVIELVEFQALCRSLNRVLKREKLEWQTWTRVGLISRSVARTVNHSKVTSEG